MNPKLHAALDDVTEYVYEATDCGVGESEYVAEQILMIVEKYL